MAPASKRSSSAEGMVCLLCCIETRSTDPAFSIPYLIYLLFSLS
jgi:hypothetical protein